jgi:hypothetical protein
MRFSTSFLHFIAPITTMFLRSVAVSALFLFAGSARGQAGFEFEVYGAAIPERGSVELELHTNFVPSGMQMVDDLDGRATHRALRSSLELSTGLASWLAGSVYAVTYARNGAGVQYVGNRVRLTAVAPKRWSLPFDAGISQEVGYARQGFSEHRWSYEIAPIIGRKAGPLSFLVNPTLERGLDAGDPEWELEPRAQMAYAVADDAALAMEYYGVLGPLSSFDTGREQRHQLFLTGEREFPRGLAAAVGIGRGLTGNSDRWVISSRLELEF